MTKPLVHLAVVLFAAAFWPCAAFGTSLAEHALLEASGVPADRVNHCRAAIDQLAAEFKSLHSFSRSQSPCARELHEFLHQRVLRGNYLASASNVGEAILGGPFNCVAATIVLCMLCDRCGLPATAMATRGHVWCRVEDPSGTPIDVETTCRNWFKIAAKYRDVPTTQVSAAMAAHRQRVQDGRALSDRQLLAVLHFNRGVTRIYQNRLAEAAWSNLQAISFDPACRPAWENLAAVRKQLATDDMASAGTHSRLIYWAIDQAASKSRTSMVAN